MRLTRLTQVSGSAQRGRFSAASIIKNSPSESTTLYKRQKKKKRKCQQQHQPTDEKMKTKTKKKTKKKQSDQSDTFFIKKKRKNYCNSCNYRFNFWCGTANSCTVCDRPWYEILAITHKYKKKRQKSRAQSGRVAISGRISTLWCLVVVVEVVVVGGDWKRDWRRGEAGTTG